MNWPEWQTHETWKSRTSEILPPHATGWFVAGAWLIEEDSSETRDVFTSRSEQDLPYGVVPGSV
jgi:hypothetical protein